MKKIVFCLFVALFLMMACGQGAKQAEADLRANQPVDSAGFPPPISSAVEKVTRQALDLEPIETADKKGLPEGIKDKKKTAIAVKDHLK